MDQIEKVKEQLYAALQVEDEEWATHKAQQLAELLNSRTRNGEAQTSHRVTVEDLLAGVRVQIDWVRRGNSRVQVERDSAGIVTLYMLPRINGSTLNLTPKQLGAARRCLPLEGDELDTKVSVSRVTLTNWERGEAVPTIRNLSIYIEFLEAMGVKFLDDECLLYDCKKEDLSRAPTQLKDRHNDAQGSIEIMRSESGNWIFKLSDKQDNNGMVSKEYPNRDTVLKAISTAKQSAENLKRFEIRHLAKGYRLILKARNGRFICQSPTFYDKDFAKRMNIVQELILGASVTRV